MRVLVAPEALAQIDTIDDWWQENRTASPNLFFQELAATLSLLADAPGLGRRYAHASVRSVRRMLMRSTRYHVYYVVRADTVLVLSVWSALRGTGPDLSSALRG